MTTSLSQTTTVYKFQLYNSSHAWRGNIDWKQQFYSLTLHPLYILENRKSGICGTTCVLFAIETRFNQGEKCFHCTNYTANIDIMLLCFYSVYCAIFTHLGPKLKQPSLFVTVWFRGKFLFPLQVYHIHTWLQSHT